jgi:hypothetical protein
MSADVDPFVVAESTQERNASMASVQAFADDIWLVDGPPVRDVGFEFTTRMTIVKLTDRTLWVSSPVPAPLRTLNQIVALGPVRYLVAATPRHVWRLELWHTLFPAAQLWVPRPTLLTVRARLPAASRLTATAPPAWAADLDQLPFEGNPLGEEVVFFHKRSRTVILDDLIMRALPVRGGWVRRALSRLLVTGGVPRDIAARLAFTDRAAARRSLDRLLAWDFDRLVIAHGACIQTGARPFVERAFRWLARPDAPA